MSFIDSLKSLLGFKEGKVENIVVPEPMIVTPIEETPEEKMTVSEPMVCDTSMETPMTETATSTENQ